ncbi:hypothetical protein NIES2104_32020 [Leptolyngbya sp. NIES-2104]|nr:hypothetical protein NIES2104_32020 [Leptolyngbya sp. NIES-2104]
MLPPHGRNCFATLSAIVPLVHPPQVQAKLLNAAFSRNAKGAVTRS